MSPQKTKTPLIWSTAAERDLGRIYDYFRLRNPNAATGIVKKILQAVSSLSHYPRLGHPSKFSIDCEYRELICDHFCIIYRLEKANILLLRVWDTRRNPDEFFVDES